MEFNLSSLISELHSIESLLDDVLQRHCLLFSRLGVLPQDVPSSAESLENSVTPSAVRSLSWPSIVRTGRRISLPLFSLDGDDDPLKLLCSTLGANWASCQCLIAAPRSAPTWREHVKFPIANSFPHLLYPTLVALFLAINSPAQWSTGHYIG